MSKSSGINKSKQQKKSAMLIYIAIGTAVVATGIGGAYLYFTQRSQSIKGMLGAVAAIPQEAQVVMAFNTKSEPWKTSKMMTTTFVKHSHLFLNVYRLLLHLLFQK